MRTMQTVTIAVLSILALVLTTLLPRAPSQLVELGSVDAATSGILLLHAPLPTVPAPGVMAIDGQ